VTLILVARAESQKFGGEDSKWKFTTSCASVSYNFVFVMDTIVLSKFHTVMSSSHYLEKELTFSAFYKHDDT